MERRGWAGNEAGSLSWEEGKQKLQAAFAALASDLNPFA
jgi:hypothetical protein